MDRLSVVVLIAAAVCAVAWAIFAGPAWLSVPAALLLIAPFVVLCAGLAWFGGQAYAGWFVARWYRIPAGLLLAAGLILLDFGGFEFPSGEPAHGYLWGSLIVLFFTSVAVAAVRERRHL